ncbi:hypothetical protein ACFTZB_41235 [Rhodococcus sp. NPDC057014]|uniref:hypothetical protein n=1 Tax=Rhodococcus sp. NPDC057014 TaxID=3346000 RepID=UPI00363D25AA
MTHLSEQERQTLWRVADVLIPATATRPGLRDADPDGLWLERALTARSDLVGALQAELARLETVPDLEPAVIDLHESDRARFEVLATAVSGAYYLVPAVRELIGYPGQHRTPPRLEEAAEELSDEVFEAAMNYPGSYRPTPR